MKKKKSNQSQKATVRKIPGENVFIGEQKVETVRIEALDYTPKEVTEHTDLSSQELSQLAGSEGVTWINITGIHDPAKVAAIGNSFGLHSLTVEDIVNTAQRPKLEVFPDYIFFAIKLIHEDPQDQSLLVEHISLVLGASYVISFQESEEDVFGQVRRRVREGKGRIRKMGADYLAYCLLDAVIDDYFLLIEHMEHSAEVMDDKLFGNSDELNISEIHGLKRKVLLVRKAVWPIRESVNSLERTPSDLIGEEVRYYLRDLCDHTVQIKDQVDVLRELLDALQETFQALVSHKTNEVMGVLTVMSTIFIPLSFIVGVYGMNFDVMPELHFRYGYFIVWGVMAFIALAMIAYFRSKKWL